MGSLSQAADALEEGRKLDLADKWINSKASKYLLRSGRIKEGEDVVGLFTKHEGDSRDYLMEMQTMWYEIELGLACFKEGKMALALKFFKCVAKHFDDIEDDQLEFHSYCLRKFTLRAYINMLRMIDTHRKHPFFTRAAHATILCYLHIHDQRGLFAKEEEPETPDLSTMSAADKKKYKAKMRKLEAKKKKEDEDKKKEEEDRKKAAAAEEEEEGTTKKKRMRDVPVDLDPDGSKAFEEESQDPLKHGHALMQVVNRFAPSNLQTHLDTFDVEVRRGKYLQATKALFAATNLSKSIGGIDHPEIFARLAPFFFFVLEKGAVTYAPWAGLSTNAQDLNKPVEKAVELSPIARQVVEAVAGELFKEKPKAMAQAFYQKYTAPDSADLGRRIAACKAMLLIDPSNPAPFKAATQGPLDNARFEQFESIKAFLACHGAPEDMVRAFSEKAAERFPPSQGSPSPAQE